MSHRAHIISVAGKAYVRCVQTNATAVGKCVVEALSKLRRECQCVHRKEYNIDEVEARHNANRFMKDHEDRQEDVLKLNGRVLQTLRSNWRVT